MTLKKRIKKFNKWLLLVVMKYILPIPGLLFVQMLSYTYRIRIIGKEHETYVKANYPSVIYASIHQRFFMCFRLCRTRLPAAVMISKSRDAEGVARMVKLAGAECVRGSSSKGNKYKGGREALEELKELTEKGTIIYHPVDGPLGPFGIVKPGVIKLAQMTECPVLAVTMTAEKKWAFNSWDKFVIPKPFSRNIIHVSEPVYIPKELNDTEFETYRRDIEKKLSDNMKYIESIWRDPKEVSRIFKHNPKD